MFTFSTSILIFWIKGKVEVDSHSVYVEIPHTVLSIIPLRVKNDTIPIQTISNLQMNSTYKLIPLLIGGFLAMSSLANIFETGFGGLIFLAIYLAIAGSGIRSTLTFNRSGVQQVISVPFFEAKKLHAIKNEIHTQINDNMSQKDLNYYFKRK